MKYCLPRKENNAASTRSNTATGAGSPEDKCSRVSGCHPSTSLSGSSYIAARSIASLRPPKQMGVVEADDGGARIDSTSYHHMCQDITSLKTMLFRLKRVLQEVGQVSISFL